MNPWIEYERLKKEWIARYPDATSKEYEAFIQALTEELGL